VLSGLEFNIDINDIISKNKVLIVALNPRRLRAVLYLTDLQTGKDEIGVDLC
jgi:hypothetical protein